MADIAAEILQFLAVVFWRWQGWLGGGGLGGAVVVFVGIYERLIGHTLSKRMYVAIFIVAFLLGAFFLAWRDEQHAKLQLDRQVKSLQGTLDSLSKPKFIATIDDVRLGTNSLSRETVVFIFLSIRNEGAPSIAEAWSLKLDRSSEHKEIKASMFPEFQTQDSMTIPEPDGIFRLRLDDILYEKAIRTPIQRGALVSGWTIFIEPTMGLEKELMDTKRPFTWTVIFHDVAGREHRTEPSTFSVSYSKGKRRYHPGTLNPPKHDK